MRGSMKGLSPVFLCALVLFMGPRSGAAFANTALLGDLLDVAPTLDRKVLQHAVTAMQCAQDQGEGSAKRLAIIDFSLPSSQQRLWIFDLEVRELLLHELVAHGQGSGHNLATQFSNISGSHQSSIGLFRTGESYYGRHGYSLRTAGQP